MVFNQEGQTVGTQYNSGVGDKERILELVREVRSLRQQNDADRHLLVAALRALRQYVDVAHEYGTDLCEFIPDLDGAQAAMAERTAVYVQAYRTAGDVLGNPRAIALLAAAKEGEDG